MYAIKQIDTKINKLINSFFIIYYIHLFFQYIL
jgi:hypothetical protein